VSLPERHRYGSARAQYGELFAPAGAGPWPVAVVLHGGFWRAQYGRRLMRPLCADLAARGWAAFNVEYRRLGRLSGGGFPRTLDDVAAAVDHLAELPAHEPVGTPHADGGEVHTDPVGAPDLEGGEAARSDPIRAPDLEGGEAARTDRIWAPDVEGGEAARSDPIGAPDVEGGEAATRGAAPILDLARVVAIGHSAGGHLAAWLATRPHARVPVTAVVAQAGVLDLRLASDLRLSRGVVHRLLGGTPAAVPERYAAASPAERLPLGVPALLTHGGRDEVVPPLMSERFAAAAKAAGDDVELVFEPQAYHYGHLDPASALWRAVTAWIR